MGFIIWYKVEIDDPGAAGGLLSAVASLIGAGLPLKVSNDVFSGTYILDADICLDMLPGAKASTFAVTLTNLPADVADMVGKKQTEGLAKQQPLQAKFYLGYFEDGPTFTSPDPVMTGAVMHVKSTVGDDGLLRTVIWGQELAGYRLRTTCIEKGQQGPTVVDDFVKTMIIAPLNAPLPDDSKLRLAEHSNLNLTWPDFTLRSDNALLALGEIADRAKVPLVIGDRTICLGQSVGAPPSMVTFDPDVNIVQVDQVQDTEEDPEPCAKREDGQVATMARTSYSLMALGDPKLRVGQQAALNTPDKPQGTLRVNQVTHRFSTSSGYTCQVILVVADQGKLVQKPEVGAHGVITRLSGLASRLQDQRTPIDVGQVTAYNPGQQKHRATLNYGQSPPSDTVTPSVQTPVDEDNQLFNRPIASVFAWQKCGLMVPVYPGMRALLAHNRGQVSDASIMGFLWPEDPKADPPQNQPGDYWLCLPTQLGGPNNEPMGKGVNDLIDSSGLRVIQTKGLHILVGSDGSDKLPDVGVRPTIPDGLGKTIKIEHESGTTITIDGDGKVQIVTQGQDISLTNGSVTLKLGKSAVEVS